MHKVRNLRVGVGNYGEVVNRIRDHGIGVIGAFIFGGDGDTSDVFHRTVDFILDSKMDGIQLSILTPLPGTRLYTRLQQEGRLLRTDYPDDWRYYDFLEVVYRPRNMSPNELKEGVTQVYKRTTSRLASARRALHSLLQTGTPNLYGAAAAYLWNRGYGSLWMRKCRHMKGELHQE